MTRDLKAIATRYRGFEFRSRLEAKYAVWFDLCGWRWAYEPLDYEGWIPDFAIGERPTLVEVKPFYRAEEFNDQIRKIRDSQYRDNVVLLGADPTWIGVETDGGKHVGWLLVDDMVEPMNFGFTCGNGKLGLCSDGGGAFINPIWNTKPGKESQVFLSRDNTERYLVEAWGHACNVAKWIPSGASVA